MTRALVILAAVLTWLWGWRFSLLAIGLLVTAGALAELGA